MPVKASKAKSAAAAEESRRSRSDEAAAQYLKAEALSKRENGRDAGFAVPISKSKCVCGDSARCQSLRKRAQFCGEVIAKRAGLIRVPRRGPGDRDDENIIIRRRIQRYDRFCRALGVDPDNADLFTNASFALRRASTASTGVTPPSVSVLFV